MDHRFRVESSTQVACDRLYNCQEPGLQKTIGCNAWRKIPLRTDFSVDSNTIDLKIRRKLDSLPHVSL